MKNLLLSNVTSTGPSGALFLNRMTAKHTIAVEFADANASISAVSVALEAAGLAESGDDLTGVVWHTLATHALTAAELAAKSCMFHVVDKVVGAVRVNITVLNGLSAGDNVSVAYLSED